MLDMALAHVSRAIADTHRAARGAFFLDVFGAETAFEMPETSATAAMGFDREEWPMLIGDTMPIAIAPAGAMPGSPLSDMLRRSVAPAAGSGWQCPWRTWQRQTSPSARPG